MIYDKKFKNSLKLNQFCKDIVRKKQYLKKLNNKTKNFIKQKDFKNFTNNVFQKKPKKVNELVSYIIDFSVSRSNILLSVTSASGVLKFFCSAGIFSYSGKGKKSKISVFNSMIDILIRKLKFLINKPIALHLKNVGFLRFWVLKRLKKKFLIKSVKNFNVYSYNGCRKKKVKRKKFKKIILKKGWLSGLKRQIVNLLSISSQVRILLSSFSNPKYNAEVACLLWEQKVMCSNHITSISFLYEY